MSAFSLAQNAPPLLGPLSTAQPGEKRRHRSEDDEDAEGLGAEAHPAKRHAAETRDGEEPRVQITSQTAKKILETLELMSSPLADSKRVIPAPYSARINYQRHRDFLLKKRKERALLAQGTPADPIPTEGLRVPSLPFQPTPQPQPQPLQAKTQPPVFPAPRGAELPFQQQQQQRRQPSLFAPAAKAPVFKFAAPPKEADDASLPRQTHIPLSLGLSEFSRSGGELATIKATPVATIAAAEDEDGAKSSLKAKSALNTKSRPPAPMARKDDTSRAEAAAPLQDEDLSSLAKVAPLPVVSLASASATSFTFAAPSKSPNHSEGDRQRAKAIPSGELPVFKFTATAAAKSAPASGNLTAPTKAAPASFTFAAPPKSQAAAAKETEAEEDEDEQDDDEGSEGAHDEDDEDEEEEHDDENDEDYVNDSQDGEDDDDEEEGNKDEEGGDHEEEEEDEERPRKQARKPAEPAKPLVPFSAPVTFSFAGTTKSAFGAGEPKSAFGDSTVKSAFGSEPAKSAFGTSSTSFVSAPKSTSPEQTAFSLPATAPVEKKASAPESKPAGEEPAPTPKPSAAASKWTCPVCMVPNDDSAAKCVCCEADKPGLPPAPKPTGPVFSFATPSSSSPSPFQFGAPAVAPLSTSSTAASEPAAKPPVTTGFSLTGSATPAFGGGSGGFVFGGSVATEPRKEAEKAPVPEKKPEPAPALVPAAAAAGSKWTCPVCMVPNDDSAAKCVCCEGDKPGLPPAPKPAGPTFNFAAPSSSAGTFQFGAPATSASSAPVTAKPEVAIDSSKSFTFGGAAPVAAVAPTTAAVIPTPTAPTAAPVFSFGTPSQAGAPVFTFGGPAATAAAAPPTATPAPTLATPQLGPAPFAFGQQAVAAATAPVAQPTSQPFVFGQQPAQQPQGLITQPPAPTFAFGQPQQASSTPTTTAPTFSFGQTMAPTAAPAVQAPSQPTFVFGQSAAQPAPIFGASSTSPSPFGTSTPAPAPASVPTSSFAFGTPAVSNPPMASSPFFAGAQPNPIFGAPAAAPPLASPNIFGTSTAPAASPFGAVQQLQQNPNPTGFGGAPTPFGQQVAPFGGSATNTPPIGFGGAPTPNPFGQQVAPFGVATPPRSNTPTPTPYGAPAAQQGSFVFGAATQSFTAGAGGAPTFGGANQSFVAGNPAFPGVAPGAMFNMGAGSAPEGRKVLQAMKRGGKR